MIYRHGAVTTVHAHLAWARRKQLANLTSRVQNELLCACVLQASRSNLQESCPRSCSHLCSRMASLRLLLVEKENNRKKVVQVPSDVTVTALTELAANSFDLLPGSTVIECYDADFEEWVMVSEDFTPRDKQRLQVTFCSVSSPQ